MLQNLLSKQRKETPHIILWGVKVSPYVRKVMVALAEKQIAYEQKEILPKLLLQATHQPIPEEFLKTSPLGKIPALQVNESCIADSAVIIAYLDHAFKQGNALYPSDSDTYAKALWFECYSDTVLTDVAYKKIFVENVIKPHVLNQPTDKTLVQKAIEEELPSLLDYLQKSLGNNSWIAGKHFSVGDIAIATQFLALDMAGVKLNDKRWEKLNDYFQRVISRSSFKTILS